MPTTKSSVLLFALMCLNASVAFCQQYGLTLAGHLPFIINEDVQQIELKQNVHPYPGDLKNVDRSENPFAKFIGEWALKDDNWSHNWGQGTEHIKIPNHHSLCKELNTKNSLLWVVDATLPKGHIFWSYDQAKKEVHHLSSFGTSRNGVGKGHVNAYGDVTLRLSFSDEPAGTYRMYSYTWISDNEYEMMSKQYDTNGKHTGIFYGGTFIRISKK